MLERTCRIASSKALRHVLQGSTIDIGAMAMPALLMMIFLMFIGGGSGSTAGGIKPVRLHSFS